MLGNVLVEHLLIELFWIFLCNFIVQSSSMWFNDVALAWGRAVSQRVVLSVNVALEDLLVLCG